jgi:hypothetical protein
MKATISERGYILATSFINIYAEDHKDTMTKDLMAIRKDLKKITIGIKNRGVNIYNELDIAWKYFNEAVGDDKSYTISVLTFVFQFILKNPNRVDNFLFERTWKLNKEHLFSKDQLIDNAKQLVIKFYKESV